MLKTVFTPNTVRTAIVLLSFFGLAAFAAGASHAPPSHVGFDEINLFAWDSTKPPPVGWLFINFVIFVFVLLRFAKPSLKQAMVERSRNIGETIEKNALALTSAESKHREVKDLLSGLSDEKDKLKKAMAKQADAEGQRILDEAKANGERMKSETGSLIDNERIRTQQRLKQETVKEALEKAESLLNTTLGEDDHRRLIDEAIDQLALVESTTTPSSEPARARAGA